MTNLETAKKSSEVIHYGNQFKKQIAFTYDTGTLDTETTVILKVLREHAVKGTFFTTGIWAQNYPKLLKQIVLEGHEIGNHTSNHPDMTTISYAQMLQTILEGEQIIQQITGIKTHLFRPPYGHYNATVLEAIYEAGYPQSIIWSIDTFDWRLPSLQAIVNRILHRPHNGAIVLMHVAGDHTAEASYKAIGNLKARGYDLVTISSLL